MSFYCVLENKEAKTILGLTFKMPIPLILLLPEWANLNILFVRKREDLGLICLWKE